MNCWNKFVHIEEGDGPNGGETGIEAIDADGLLISARGGMVTVSSAETEGQTISLYGMDGKAMGAGTIRNGQASIIRP